MKLGAPPIMKKGICPHSEDRESLAIPTKRSRIDANHRATYAGERATGSKIAHGINSEFSAGSIHDFPQKWLALNNVMHALPEGGFLGTFDLKSGYHHVRIAEHHAMYLGFLWDNVYYQFICLPF